MEVYFQLLTVILQQHPLGKKHALKRYEQCSVKILAAFGKVQQKYTLPPAVLQFHEIFVTKKNLNMYLEINLFLLFEAKMHRI